MRSVRNTYPLNGSLKFVTTTGATSMLLGEVNNHSTISAIPSGRIILLCSSALESGCQRGVSTDPGQTVKTRMPCGFPSIFSTSESPFMPCLLALLGKILEICRN